MYFIKGCASLCYLAINTILCALPFYFLALIKLLVPSERLQLHCLAGLNRIAGYWIDLNNLWIRHILRPSIELTRPDGLSPHQWWLVISNHQSWTDILLLQLALRRQIPVPRFFIKRELIWIPVIGLAWWALEFPLMYRKGSVSASRRDMAATRRLCQRARHTPIAIYNFVEGTRFTPAKKAAQQSPFTHLLKPKAGGVGVVLSMLGDRLSGILDVTLDYRQGSSRFWDFLCGRSGLIKLTIHQLPVEPWMYSAGLTDVERKQRFHTWVNTLWHDKDQRLSSSSS